MRRHGWSHGLTDNPRLTQENVFARIGNDRVLGYHCPNVVSVCWRQRTGRQHVTRLSLIGRRITRDGFPETGSPCISASKFIAPNHDHHATGCLALRMVTPTATSQSGFLKKAAGLTLLLRHAFPQVRLPSRSGKTRPRASEPNPFQAVPNLRPMFDAATQGLLLPQVRPDSTNPPCLCLSVTTMRVNAIRLSVVSDGTTGTRVCYTHPLDFCFLAGHACGRSASRPLETWRPHVTTTHDPAPSRDLAGSAACQREAVSCLDHRLSDERGR